MTEQKKNPPYPRALAENIKQLRKAPTKSEQKLFAALRAMRSQTGLKFRRQHPIGHYIADFYCHSLSLVIEIDGISHDNRQKADVIRDAYMKKRGICVMRFTEKQVCEDVEAVIVTIFNGMDVSPPPTPPEGRGVAPCLS